MLDLDLDWAPLRVALEGQSFVDIPRLNISSKAEAKNFLLSYGYDTEDPTVREELWRLYFQSISFIRNHLLDPGEKMPEEFLVRGPQSDILRLLVDASQPTSLSGLSPLAREKRLKGRWSCAILRVMHIISHLDNDVRLEHFQQAREQIFARFDALVSAAGPRRWRFSAGNRSIDLVRFIKKERKERNSVLIKLLSKPHNVVEEIYDRIGFRFVTENRLDCYRLVNLMISSGVVSGPNIQPGRSLNSIIPFEALHDTVSSIHNELERGDISLRLARRRLQKLEEEERVPLGEVRNPYSSRWYRAVQFTCRQLVSAPDPTFRFWNEVKAAIKKDRAGAALLKKIPVSLREKRSFYYPFEIQVMDIQSYVESIGGRSRHRDYKARQRLMARNRVLRDLV